MKSIDGNVSLAFQWPFACMNDPRASKPAQKQIIFICVRSSRGYSIHVAHCVDHR